MLEEQEAVHTSVSCALPSLTSTLTLGEPAERVTCLRGSPMDGRYLSVTRKTRFNGPVHLSPVHEMSNSWRNGATLAALIDLIPWMEACFEQSYSWNAAISN